ncbi:unnamed protein product [Clonostachys rhizophaga]|uniref:Peptidase A1 domain-containing protein n=1 Tax=Clonostachys rhizophaga TaxID=160324 RepID=A0A9N9V7H1_9HYPO|nr:unnamed protein product [Clonostachys rhizophaga]
MGLKRVLVGVAIALSLVTTAWAAVVANPGWDISMPMNGFSFKQVSKDPILVPDKPTSKVSRLRRVKGTDEERSAASLIRRASLEARSRVGEPDSNITAVGGFSTQYAIECKWDDTPVWLIFDTGSSDTWNAQSGFVCQDRSGKTHDQSSCGLRKPHIERFRHGAIEELHFYLHYGSGEKVYGPMGYSDISCGGVTVTRQQVGLANHTYWHGNNVTSGILGLAYSALTSAYYGKIGDEGAWNIMTYPPFLTTAAAEGELEPLFSVAIMRNSSDGVLAWGGLPPIHYDENVTASADIIIAKLSEREGAAWSRSFYTIIPDGLKWGTTTDEAKYPYIIDTGTTMMHLPPPLAETIAAAFEPKADSYYVDCNAVPPSLAVVIDGVEFWINPADLIYKHLVDPLTGYCAIGITGGGSGPYILGDVFLQNVLAVFDIRGGEMRFYSRN